MRKTLIVTALTLAASTAMAHADEVKVAVAANFYKPLQVLAKDYQQTSSDKVVLSVGSTGKLYAQIVNGAPFDIFLAADQKRPQKLVKADAAVAKSEFTYAKGRLAFWSKQSGLIDSSDSYLKAGKFNKLAIANPKAAPYGAASVETLKKLGLYSKLKDKIVYGQNIGQTYSYVNYGNVKQGFVALSQVYRDGKLSAGSGWIVPNSYYHAIRQDAVLLSKSADNQAAQKFLAYLQSPKAKKIIRSFGYDVSEK
ncbi:molybdate ABC transporter substrate-binding protein [Celerinatantimonas sp. MCCC 1A17872]|uniref:molybdate ABC transporter substrate-binding protein n=1 Tax=Celerinatantimonas sp. MCCC 1A17872 TaxID=3177514 RepID=UPI0038C2E4F2